ncbi:unnamed protein product [Closterium sp. NIES-53]
MNGFVRVAGSCVEACPSNQCGDNSVCYKNAAGGNTCACNDGYTWTVTSGCLGECSWSHCMAGWCASCLILRPFPLPFFLQPPSLPLSVSPFLPLYLSLSSPAYQCL